VFNRLSICCLSLLISVIANAQTDSMAQGADVPVASEAVVAATSAKSEGPDMSEREVRDPTTPLGFIEKTKGKAVQSFQLNSILWSSQRRQAIINGQALHEGQVIAGTDAVRVKRISRQEVILQSPTSTWALQLTPMQIRKH
jgi:hypothetical protein